LIDRAKGYGMEGVRIDGNNILEVYETIKNARAYCINQQKPFLVECMTFRMRGHEEASGTKYVPKELFETWAQKDPIKNYEHFLIEEGFLNEMQVADLKHQLKENIENDLKTAMELQPLEVSIEKELSDVFAPYEPLSLAEGEFEFTKIS
jgi:2-oxoisovalerate dehydrogenase E1 component